MFVWQYNVHLFAVPFQHLDLIQTRGICFHVGLEYICQKSPFGNLNIYGCRFFTERSFVIVKAFIYLEI